MLFQCLLISFQSAITDSQVFGSCQNGNFFISLLNQMFGCHKASGLIIQPNTGCRKVRRYSVEHYYRQISILNFFKMFERFGFTGNRNNKAIYQAFEQSLCIQNLSAERFITLAYHYGIACF